MADAPETDPQQRPPLSISAYRKRRGSTSRPPVMVDEDARRERVAELLAPETNDYGRLRLWLALIAATIVVVGLLPGRRPADALLWEASDTPVLLTAGIISLALAILARRTVDSTRHKVLLGVFAALWAGAAYAKHNAATFATTEHVVVGGKWPWQGAKTYPWGEETSLGFACSTGQVRRAEVFQVQAVIGTPGRQHHFVKGDIADEAWVRSATTLARAAESKGVELIRAPGGVDQACLDAQRSVLPPRAYQAFEQLMRRTKDA